MPGNSVYESRYETPHTLDVARASLGIFTMSIHAIQQFAKRCPFWSGTGHGATRLVLGRPIVLVDLDVVRLHIIVPAVPQPTSFVIARIPLRYHSIKELRKLTLQMTLQAHIFHLGLQHAEISHLPIQAVHPHARLARLTHDILLILLVLVFLILLILIIVTPLTFLIIIISLLRIVLIRVLHGILAGWRETITNHRALLAADANDTSIFDEFL
jgi:hypothetical protein